MKRQEIRGSEDEKIQRSQGGEMQMMVVVVVVVVMVKVMMVRVEMVMEAVDAVTG